MKPLSPEQINKVMDESMKKAEEDKKEFTVEKGFFKRWKEGILNLTPIQQLKGKLIGIIGGIIGLILALIVMVYRKQWGFSIFIFFIIWLQFISYISTRQQLISTKEMLKEIKPEQEDKNSAMLDKELGNSR